MACVISNPELARKRALASRQTEECLAEIQQICPRIQEWLPCIQASLNKPRSTIPQITQLQENVKQAQAHCRALQDIYSQKKAANDKKREQWINDTAALADTKSRVKELQNMVKVLNERRHERESIISQQLDALSEDEDMGRTSSQLATSRQDAMAWYKEVLGFRIEAGEGIKCIFTNIDNAYPEREFFFTIRHSQKNNCYKLLASDPCAPGTEELVMELNKHGDLPKFVKAMRDMFQALSAEGSCM